MTAPELKKRIRSFRNRMAILSLLTLCSIIAVMALAVKLANIFKPRQADDLLDAVAALLLGSPVLICVAYVYQIRLARKLGLACSRCGKILSNLHKDDPAEIQCNKCKTKLF